MIESPISRNLGAVFTASRPFVEFLTQSKWASRMGNPDICDFVVGTPHEMPIPEYVEAIRKASIPQNTDWFGYKVNDPNARQIAANALRELVGIDFENEDLFLTNGASSALVIALKAILNPEDEVIFLSPPWFFYESMISFVHGKAVRVKVELESFDIDVEAVAKAITPRTRAIIVNSPNNPTGKIYPPETLARLSEILTAASEKFGQTIYLVSDESYNRLIFDENIFSSPTAHYPNSFLIYSYAKALLTPGQRLGYLAVSPLMHERDKIRRAVQITQYNLYAFPDAVHLHALADIEPMIFDLKKLQDRRDKMAQALSAQGFELHIPEGAWYLLPKTPIENDVEFAAMLAEKDVFVLPGSIVELPGYLRICLTANDEMVEKALPVFEWAMKSVSNPKTVTIAAS
ncbi:MAG TPA: aminotransferase class I/II-fold pyridoxal phosphate-dependent enzyme [Pyrinomonadaceae bacterium]|nr:aminotransferase class I/II-fold pyridoxal phosphate-dependent enzyme [Pyrinomonadaceae bacterium]